MLKVGSYHLTNHGSSRNDICKVNQPRFRLGLGLSHPCAISGCTTHNSMAFHFHYLRNLENVIYDRLRGGSFTKAREPTECSLRDKRDNWTSQIVKFSCTQQMMQLIILHWLGKKSWELPHLIRFADGKVRVSRVKGVRTNQPYFYPYAALLKCIIGRIFLIRYEYWNLRKDNT